MTNVEFAVHQIKEQELDFTEIVGGLCQLAYFSKHCKTCGYIPCHKCEFRDDRDAVDQLLAQHKD